MNIGDLGYGKISRNRLKRNSVNIQVFNTGVCVDLLNWLVSRARSIHRTIDRWRYLSPFFSSLFTKAVTQ